MMPRVEVRLFGHLRSYMPVPEAPSATVFVPEGGTLGDLLEQMDVPPEDPKILLVNGVHAGRDRRLAEGDRVSVFPPIAGG